jgi:hypothetical protein
MCAALGCMKIQDIPQTGKLGQTVTWKGRTGLLRRIKVTPKNPRSAPQQIIRSRLAAQAAAYDALSDVQQEAWIRAAAQVQTRATLGQSGPLTGMQLFAKVNCTLAVIGAPSVNAPPVKALMDTPPVSGLEITNVAGVVSLKLTTTDAPEDGTILRASECQRSGTRRAVGYRVLGVMDSPVNNKIDITAAYVARFGSPRVNSRVFVVVTPCVNGYEGIPVLFQARVPAAA